MSSIIKSLTPITQASLGGITGDQILQNTDPYLKPEPASNGIVNVVKNYSWFSGGSKEAIAGLNKCPFAILTEREQLLNSVLSQALYYINAAANVGADVESVVSKFSESIGLSEPDSETETARKSSRIKGLVDKITSFQDKDRALMKANKLESLVGIYLTEPTGFDYVFPYFESPPDISNSWGASDGSNKLTGMISSGLEVVDEVSNIANIAQPGIYIQKPKYYQHSPDGPSITIKFPLFNTIKRSTDKPYQQNYELLWLLAYQNKTFKTSFGRSLPPKIYTVTIPGVVNMPYAHISNMSVEFLGTIRNKDITLPTGVINAPVPEAYNVTITVQSLLTDYANLMVGAGFTASSNGLTVTKTFNQALNNTISSLQNL